MPRFRFDRSRHALTGPDGEAIRLRPQSLAVFLLLLENADEVVRKDAILERVWKGVVVGDDSLVQCVADIRRTLGEEHRGLLQTVPKVGYRLCLGRGDDGEPVIRPLDAPDQTAGRARPSTTSPPAPPGSYPDRASVPSRRVDRRRQTLLVGALALLALAGLGTWQAIRPNAPGAVPSHGPTIAVLPLRNASPSAENHYFSDGLTEDIITALGRFSNLGVASWNAVAGLSTDAASVRRVADEFGVRYLVTGSVRHDDERVRVAVKLVDAHDARLLWSERYDEPLEDVFVVQDRISRQVAATLAITLTDIETALVREVPTRNMTAYQLVLLGRSAMRQRTREGNSTARARFGEAIALDPGYAEAHLQLGRTHIEAANLGWTEWPRKSLEEALALGRTAIELDGRTPRALGFLAEAHVRTGEYGKAQTYLDRAFERSPDDPALHRVQGLLHIWNGEAGAAIPHLQYVLRYDPSSTFASSYLGIAYYVSDRPQDAVRTIEHAIETAPDAHFMQIILTAAYVDTGDIEAARRSAAVVRRQYPFLRADGASRTEIFATEAARRRVGDALRRVGFD